MNQEESEIEFNPIDENTKHIVASNLTAAFYAGYVRSTEYKDADDLDQAVKMTYTGFLYWLDDIEGKERIKATIGSESSTRQTEE